jgi:hypothetical protein
LLRHSKEDSERLGDVPMAFAIFMAFVIPHDIFASAVAAAYGGYIDGRG